MMTIRRFNCAVNKCNCKHYEIKQSVIMAGGAHLRNMGMCAFAFNFSLFTEFPALVNAALEAMPPKVKFQKPMFQANYRSHSTSHNIQFP